VGKLPALRWALRWRFAVVWSFWRCAFALRDADAKHKAVEDAKAKSVQDYETIYGEIQLPTLQIETLSDEPSYDVVPTIRTMNMSHSGVISAAQDDSVAGSSADSSSESSSGTIQIVRSKRRMSRELTELSADVRALLSEPLTALVLATAPLSHAQRVNATPLRPLSAVAVPESVLSDDDEMTTMKMRMVVKKCSAGRDCVCRVGRRVGGVRGTCARKRSMHTFRAFESTIGAVLFARRLCRRAQRRAIRPHRRAARADAASVRDFVVLRVDSIRESMVGAKQTELDASIDGLPALRSAAVARAYKRPEERKRSDLSALQSLPVVDDGLDPSQQVFELTDEPRLPRSRRPSGLVQLDTSPRPRPTRLRLLPQRC
jgi:hypothetical protein